MQKCQFQGREVMPEEMAKLVLKDAEAHQWFDDSPPASKDGALPFDDAAVTSMRRARMLVGADLVYLDCSLPAADSFPVWADLLGLHRDLVKAKSIEVSVTQGAILALVDSRLETFEKAQTLVKLLEDRIALKAKLAGARQPWLDTLARRFADMQPGDPVLQSLLAMVADVRRLERHRRELVAKAVDVPLDAELNKDFAEALTRLVAGKSAFPLPFGKGDARKLIAAATVTGGSPASKGDWELVQATLGWRNEARKVLARWNSLSAEFGLAAPDAGVEAGFKKVALWQSGIEDVRQLTFDFDAKLHSRLEEVFGKRTADRMWEGGEAFVAGAYSSLQAHVDKGRLAYAMKRVQELVRKLEGHRGAIVGQLRGFLTEALGRLAADESELQATWLTLLAELSRLTALLPSLQEISRVTAAIEAAGATKWAKRLRTQEASADMDALTPANWLDAWNWRQAVMFLDAIDGHHKVRELFHEREALTTALARTYQELVAEKTWLGVFHNSPDSVRQALQAYLNAVQAMGAGTGVRAVRHRKSARDAMLRAYQAVPCWVLPQWRV